MKKTDVDICDDCRRIIANKKCSFCKKDICDECTSGEEVGTVVLDLCKNCLNKLERGGFERQSFWKEFNTEEDMEEKIIQYLKKRLILKNLSDEEEDEEESDPVYHSTIRRRARKKIGAGSWDEAMRKKTI